MELTEDTGGGFLRVVPEIIENCGGANSWTGLGKGCSDEEQSYGKRENLLYSGCVIVHVCILLLHVR